MTLANVGAMGAFAALIADHDLVSEFLADAENPAQFTGCVPVADGCQIGLNHDICQSFGASKRPFTDLNEGSTISAMHIFDELDQPRLEQVSSRTADAFCVDALSKNVNDKLAGEDWIRVIAHHELQEPLLVGFRERARDDDRKTGFAGALQLESLAESADERRICDRAQSTIGSKTSKMTMRREACTVDLVGFECSLPEKQSLLIFLSDCQAKKAARRRSHGKHKLSQAPAAVLVSSLE
jgi:hypothetical protein